MRRRLIVGLFVFGLILAVCGAKTPVDEDLAARAIVRRAIDAQGGEEQVSRLVTKPWRAKIKGTSGRTVTTGSLAHEGPERGRIEVQSSMLGVPIKVVVVTNGDIMWRQIAGITTQVTGKELEEAKDGGYRSRKVRFLVPIVREPGFKLSLLPDANVSKRPASGVRVKNEGHRDIDLYFDKETGRLVKTESRVTGPDKRVNVLEQVFSDYKEFDGVKLATKFTKYENGKLTSVEEITELTFVDKIDPSELAKP